jgi:colanic acid biosynthesis glycosyl transferase WcaI
MGEVNPRVTIVGLNYAPEPTGIAPYTSGLASGLAAAGWEVRAVTAFPHYPAWRIADGYHGRRMREVLDHVKVTRKRPYMPTNPSGIKRLLVELSFGIGSAFSRWGNPDVLILVSPALFAVAIAQMRVRLLPNRPRVIVWVQDLYSLGVAETGQLGGGGAKLMALVESRILRNADLVVVIHDRFKRQVSSALRVASDSIAVVRNWTHLIPADVNRSKYREKFGWGDEIVVLHAGNMGAKQALENVVEAARLADRESAPIRFVLLGNGNQRDHLTLLGSGIQRLEFMESLGDEDFQGAMAAANILLVNEKKGVTEMAVPSKLTSYFASKRPVIVATDAGSITAEEIATANAGLRVDAGDPQGLLDAAISLGNDESLSELFGQNGAEFQRRSLSRDTAISHYAEIITSLAGTRGR